jgi:hypothetical protein
MRLSATGAFAAEGHVINEIAPDFGDGAAKNRIGQILGERNHLLGRLGGLPDDQLRLGGHSASEARLYDQAVATLDQGVPGGDLDTLSGPGLVGTHAGEIQLQQA